MSDPRAVQFKVLTGTFALDNGNIEIEGQADTGPLMIEIPGDYIRPLIASLTNLLPKVRSASPEGQRVVFQVTDFQVMTSEFPDQVELHLNVYPDQSFAFSLPTGQLDEIAQHLQRAAEEAREGQVRSGRKPQ